MDDKDAMIKTLRNDVAKWRCRALEAASKACDECREYTPRCCNSCRIKQIKEEAEEWQTVTK